MGTSESKPGSLGKSGCSCLLTPFNKLRKNKVAPLGEYDTPVGPPPTPQPGFFSRMFKRSRSTLPPGVLLVAPARPSNSYTWTSDDATSESDSGESSDSGEIFYYDPDHEMKMERIEELSDQIYDQYRLEERRLRRDFTAKYMNLSAIVEAFEKGFERRLERVEIAQRDERDDMPRELVGKAACTF
ncbi:hypothetical protein Bbelb_250640 [Branchiostoma belcheri]|nr:hypothetical protein Bbelb_250640 [Branchiostoma belcheri]